MEICEESLTVWITDDAFLNEAIALQQGGASRIACFPGLLEGLDCDAAHNWHVDPSNAYFTDFELETYFDCPSEVEKNRSHWIEQIGQYCGEHTTVSHVDDRR